jgi:hypothetical protein
VVEHDPRVGRDLVPAVEHADLETHQGSRLRGHRDRHERREHGGNPIRLPNLRIPDSSKAHAVGIRETAAAAGFRQASGCEPHTTAGYNFTSFPTVAGDDSERTE